MRLFYLLTLAACLHSPALFAQDADEPAAIPEPSLDCEQAMTVFQDVSGMGRKDKAARNMTKRHAELAQDGWQFADMEVYTENGDLEGFFLSYTRAVSCTAMSTEKASGK